MIVVKTGEMLPIDRSRTFLSALEYPPKATGVKSTNRSACTMSRATPRAASSVVHMPELSREQVTRRHGGFVGAKAAVQDQGFHQCASTQVAISSTTGAATCPTISYSAGVLLPEPVTNR